MHGTGKRTRARHKFRKGTKETSSSSTLPAYISDQWWRIKKKNKGEGLADEDKSSKKGS